MRRLAVEATDGTGPAHSFPVYGVCQEPNRQKNGKSGMQLQRESGRLKLGKVKILKGKRAELESEPF